VSKNNEKSNLKNDKKVNVYINDDKMTANTPNHTSKNPESHHPSLFQKNNMKVSTTLENAP